MGGWVGGWVGELPGGVDDRLFDWELFGKFFDEIGRRVDDVLTRDEAEETEEGEGGDDVL